MSKWLTSTPGIALHAKISIANIFLLVSVDSVNEAATYDQPPGEAPRSTIIYYFYKKLNFSFI